MIQRLFVFELWFAGCCWWWWWHTDWQIRICWRYCCWSNSQSAEDVADWKVNMLKILLLIDQSKCWRCCWLKGQSAEDVAEGVADQKVKVLKMLLIKRSKNVDADQRVVVVENWRWRLYDVEKLPMIYRCVTLMMLMMSYISLSYYCCWWCCCRIPFSLMGSVEIL